MIFYAFYKGDSNCIVCEIHLVARYRAPSPDFVPYEYPYVPLLYGFYFKFWVFVIKDDIYFKYWIFTAE